MKKKFIIEIDFEVVDFVEDYDVDNEDVDVSLNEELMENISSISGVDCTSITEIPVEKDA